MSILSLDIIHHFLIATTFIRISFIFRGGKDITLVALCTLPSIIALLSVSAHTEVSHYFLGIWKKAWDVAMGDFSINLALYSNVSLWKAWNAWKYLIYWYYSLLQISSFPSLSFFFFIFPWISTIPTRSSLYQIRYFNKSGPMITPL